MITVNSEFRDPRSNDPRAITVKSVEKRGRWTYISYQGAAEGEMTEQVFVKSFTPMTQAPAAPMTAEAMVEAIEADKTKDVEAGKAFPISLHDAAPTKKVKAEKAPKQPKAPKAERTEPRNTLAGFSTFRQKNATVRDDNKVRHQDNGDKIATALRFAATIEDIWEVPMVMKYLDVSALKKKYATLNAGMIRMNIGNMLRGALRREEVEASKVRVTQSNTQGEIDG
jgi:hypothetical protein